MGQRALFRGRGAALASGREVFIWPAVASWSYESTERLHWLRPAGGWRRSEKGIGWVAGWVEGIFVNSPRRIMQHTQSKTTAPPRSLQPPPPPDSFCGGGEWTRQGWIDRVTTRGRRDGGRESFGCRPLLLPLGPACAAVPHFTAN